MSGHADGPGELLWGANCVGEALRAGRRRMYELLWIPEKRSRRQVAIIEAARQRGLPLRQLDTRQMAALCGGSQHQGVALRVAPFAAMALEELAAGWSGPQALVLLLDGLLDPHNLGSLVRSARCAGASGIVLPQDRCAPLSPAVARASAGALEHARIAVVPNLVRAMERLKADGFWLAGLVPRVADSLFEAELRGRIGLVIGGEEQGIRPLVRRHCDLLLAIPQAEGFDSLNAATAGAVALFEVYRQRLAAMRQPPGSAPSRHNRTAGGMAVAGPVRANDT